MSVSLNITITFDEIATYTRFTYEKLKQSIDSLQYKKFDEIYFVIDSYANTNIYYLETKENILNELKVKANELLSEYTEKIKYHVLEYENPSAYDYILEPLTGYTDVLSKRNRFYKNALVYFISIGLCQTKYMFHLDCNRCLKHNEKCNTDTSVIDQSINILENDNKLFGVCIPRENMKKIIPKDIYTSYFKSHWNDKKYHLSLQTFLINVKLFKDQTFSFIETHRNNLLSKQTEYIFDFSYNEYLPVFLNIEYSNVIKL